MLAVLLMSTGIDSPVAGWMMKRQGFGLVILHMKNSGAKGSEHRLAKILGSPLVTRNHVKTQERIMERCRRNYQCILCKRAMLREAERLAFGHGASHIITGENLGQVASQTLWSMAVISEAVSTPVLRPLLGFDKDEIIRHARQIGTYEVSVKNAQGCPYVPKSPATRPRLDAAKREEARL